MKKVWIIIAIVALTLALATPLLAEEEEGYYITGSVTVGGGGQQTSELYGVQNEIGKTAIGGCESEEFHVELGSPEYNPLNHPPEANAGGPYLVAVNETIRLNGSGQDPDEGDILTYYQWLQSPYLGAFEYDQGNENPLYTAGDTAGITEVRLSVDDGILEDSDTAMVVVYDPDGGFVTGGGWIDSPVNIEYPYMQVGGEATFGFVSKYKKGVSVPIGNTEFKFEAGDLNFHSSSYEWLVVTGSDYAMFKGEGTINSEGVYKFRIWAGDDIPDTFRIKIWEEDELGNETVMYDNEMDQAIGDGSIVIHTK